MGVWGPFGAPKEIKMKKKAPASRSLLTSTCVDANLLR